ncbi:MAG: winged helix-turn-helix domain-containing protein [Chloroflexi bacterium]|nr:winged helix-turn-helix domain-containing protein [Chloroflexota bacterium]
MKVLCFGTDSPSIEQLQLAIRFHWPDASFLIAPAHDDALALVESEGADLAVILTQNTRVSVPGFCSELRGFSDVPLIVIGDAEEENFLDEVKALEAGADDYIRSTAGLAEMVARVVALIRRAQAQGSPSGNVLQNGDLMLNPATYEVFVGGRRVNLTGTEFNLLHLLIRNKGTVVRHRMVERSLWGDHVDSSALVKKYVHRLRRKLEEASNNDHEFIRSVYGIGYLFVASQEDREQVLEHA